MRLRAAGAAALAAVLLSGCGGGGGHGSALVWVTTDRGAHVVVSRRVPAGLTAMQALERVAKVHATYGGRFVEGIDGLEGGVHRDWFYFVNGIEADRGAAEYRLHEGDVEWWDLRHWASPGEQPVVVGAFPEPFLHGYAGKVRPAVVIGHGAGAQAVARLLHARVAAAAPPGANVFRFVGGGARLTARKLPDGSVEFDFSGNGARLARDPAAVRYRFAVGE